MTTLKTNAVQFFSNALQEKHINFSESNIINPKIQLQYDEWVQRMKFEATITDKGLYLLLFICFFIILFNFIAGLFCYIFYVICLSLAVLIYF
jgi:hypothetical protein